MTDLKVIESVEALQAKLKDAYLLGNFPEAIERAKYLLKHHRAELKQIEVDRIVWIRNKAIELCGS